MDTHTFARPHRLAALAMSIGLVAMPGAVGAQSPQPSDAAATPDAIVLQMGSCCGFVPVSYNLLSMPTFTLYEDGTLIYRSPTIDVTFQGAVIELPRLLEAELSQAQVDERIAYALGPGGIADAKPVYDFMFVSDMPTTTFLVQDGDTSTTVSVYALGVMNPETTGDEAELAKLNDLAQKLSDFGPELEKMGVTSTEYQPTRYLATLYPDFEGNAEPAAPWPFTDVAPTDFVVDVHDFTSVVVLTPEQVAEVTEVPSGGIAGLLYTTPGGVRTNLAIRPMLPGEAAPTGPTGSPASTAGA
ncbi:MAG: hypothetical protein LH650_14310 [Chloroflexi bacterium]|nr:hypothetical protein [Chloroflexota bacterium]